MRRLSPDEASAWRRVAASVRRANAASPDVAPQPDQAAPRPIEAAAQIVRVEPKRRPTPPRDVGITLDGSWDRKIGSGAVTPDRTIDLHGLDLRSAHARLDSAIETAVRDGARILLLVTGRAPRGGGSRIDLPRRGIIRESVGDWLAASRHAGSIAAVRNAHPRHGGAGALYLILRRPGARRPAR